MALEKTKTKAKKEQIVEVLYQKMGNRWYSFFVINEEVFMGSVPDEAIEDLRIEKHRSAPAIKTKIRSA